MVENSPLRLQGIRLRARVLFHSTVISAAERESAYVIDGLMHNDVVKSDTTTGFPFRTRNREADDNTTERSRHRSLCERAFIQERCSATPRLHPGILRWRSISVSRLRCAASLSPSIASFLFSKE